MTNQIRHLLPIDNTRSLESYRHHRAEVNNRKLEQTQI